MKKQLIAVLLMASMALGLVACSNEAEKSESESKSDSSVSESNEKTDSSETGEDNEEPVTITGWGAYAFVAETGISSFNEQVLWKDVIPEELGITVDWTMAPPADVDTSFSLTMSDPKNLPDFFVNRGLATFDEYGTKGAFIDLSEYITAEKMPNFYAIIEEHPEILAYITSADGSIYGFPRLLTSSDTCWTGFFVREDFLEAVGKEISTTTDEFYETMLAVKEGVDTVTYPITAGVNVVKAFVWSWGIPARGQGTSANGDLYIRDGEIAYGPNQDAYREALIWLNKLYDAEIINPSWSSLGDGDMQTAIVNKESAVGMGSLSGRLTTYNRLLETDGQGRPLTFFEPLQAVEGVAPAYQGYHLICDVNCSAGISSACENVDAVIRLIDYMYSEEGIEYLTLGIEGDTYVRDDNGKIVYTEKVTESGFSSQVYLRNFIGDASAWPTVNSTEAYLMNLDEKALVGNQRMAEIVAENDTKIPSFMFDASVSEELNIIQSDLNIYVDEYFAGFVNGVYDVNDDSVWEDYIKGFEPLHLDRLLEVYNEYYDVFKAKVK